MVSPYRMETLLGDLQVGGRTAIADVTLTLDTAAYASGDVLADTQEIVNAVREAGGTGILQSLTVIDEANQGVAFTVYLLDANQAMGAENAAPTIADTPARDFLGYVDVFTSDYKDLGGVRVATIRGIGLPLKAESGSTSLYVAAVNGTGTPTFASGELRLRLGLLLD
jgi:hypothetical protein